MKRLFAFTLGLYLLAPSLAQAQTYYYRSTAPGDPQTLVRSWYKRYLRREPDAGAAAWAQSLRMGHTAEDVLATILASQEYYTAAGANPAGFVRQIFMDVIGRQPSSTEVNYWANRMRFDTRKDVAYRLLLRHPQNFSGTNPPPLNYDPGYYPDPASPTFRDPGGPYFHSPYEFNYEYRRPIRAFPLGARG
jgi:hypothetical protein